MRRQDPELLGDVADKLSPAPFLLSKSMKISQTYCVSTLLYLLCWRYCSESLTRETQSSFSQWDLRYQVCVFGHVASCVNICFPFPCDHHGSGDTPNRVRIFRSEGHSKDFSRRMVVTFTLASYPWRVRGCHFTLRSTLLNSC